MVQEILSGHTDITTDGLTDRWTKWFQYTPYGGEGAGNPVWQRAGGNKKKKSTSDWKPEANPRLTHLATGSSADQKFRNGQQLSSIDPLLFTVLSTDSAIVSPRASLHRAVLHTAILAQPRLLAYSFTSCDFAEAWRDRIHGEWGQGRGMGREVGGREWKQQTTKKWSTDDWMDEQSYFVSLPLK